MIDWLDIALHIAGAIVIMALGWWFDCLLVALLTNTVFWPAREAWQHRPNYTEIIDHPQSRLEWFCPFAIGWIIYGVLAL